MLTNAIHTALSDQLPLDVPAWRDSAARQAAVLVVLTAEDRPQVLLGRRAKHLILHPGEVAFPGGKREVEDLTPWATAKREAFEEVGITEDKVHPLGELLPLLTRFGFEVHPCVARVPAKLDLVMDEGEFDSLFMLPLQTFADRNLFRLEEMSDGERLRQVPHYTVGDDNIWGVTAAVLAQLANLAYGAGLKLERNWSAAP
ncbi:MAG: 8-oxo-dGTP pyrophosphatase MutT (NUDIX family) [Halieaceae bacterium]|jgi:8-oxo-dGTP pyrophosphatase MutT (NUDIX family)